MSQYKERINKTTETLVHTNIKKLEDYIRKYDKSVNSRPIRRMMDRTWREYNKKDETDKINFIIELRQDIQQRKESLTKEITEQYVKEGRNIHHGNTWKSIQFQVNKKLTEFYGFNPDNLEGISIEAAKRLLFPEFEKQVDSPNKDNFIFDKPDEQLDPIEQLAKYDAKAWVGTMMRLEIYKQAKRKGLLGMYQDQKGRFQI